MHGQTQLTREKFFKVPIMYSKKIGGQICHERSTVAKRLRRGHRGSFGGDKSSDIILHQGHFDQVIIAISCVVSATTMKQSRRFGRDFLCTFTRIIGVDLCHCRASTHVNCKGVLRQDTAIRIEGLEGRSLECVGVERG